MSSYGFKGILAGAFFSAGMIAGVYAARSGYQSIIDLQNAALQDLPQQTLKISEIYQKRINYCRQQLEMAENYCREELEKNDARVCNDTRILFVGNKDPLADNLLWRSYEGPSQKGFCQLIINSDSREFCPR